MAEQTYSIYRKDGVFVVNGNDEPSGKYRALYSDNQTQVTIVPIEAGQASIIPRTAINKIQKEDGSPYANYDEFHRELADFFVSASSGGGLAIDSNHVFANDGARDTYFAAHKDELQKGKTFISNGNKFELWDGDTNPTVYSNANWQDKTAVIQGPEGPAGDPTRLIDDVNAHSDKTYSSNKIVSEIQSDVKMFGDNARMAYDGVGNIFHLETKTPDGQWQQQALIEADTISDRIILQETHGAINPQPDRIILVNRYVQVPQSYGSSTTVPALRQFFVLPDGSELPLVAVWQNQLRIPQSNGTNEYAAFKSELLDPIKSFDSTGRIRYDETAKHFYFEVKDQGVWVVKGEFGDSLIIDTVKFVESKTKPTVNADAIGLFSKLVQVPISFDDQRKQLQLRPFFVLPDGSEIPLTGVWDDELRIPQGDGSNEYAAFKSEITPLKIVQAINTQLGSTDWQTGNGGVVPQPGPDFTAYYGFYHGSTIDSTALKTLTTRTINHPIGSYYGSQTSTPNYFYLALPSDQAVKISSIAQSPSTLGTIWPDQKVTVDNVEYTVFRSPNMMYDASATFKTLQ